MKKLRIKDKKLKRFLMALLWAVILLTLSIMYLSRHKDSVDGFVFLVGGLYIIFDSIFTFPKLHIKYKPSSFIIFLILALTTIWIMISPHYSLHNTVVVAIIGILLIPIIISGRSISKATIKSEFSIWFTNRTQLHKAFIIWALIVIIFLVWEATMGVLGSGSFKAWYMNPTLTNIIKPLFHNPICYLMSILLWLMLGVYLLRRGKP